MFSLINVSNVHKYVKLFNTHFFSLTSNNKTAVYHSPTMPVAVSARSPAQRTRVKGRKSSHRSFNQMMLELLYRKYNWSAVSHSVVGVCSAPPTVPICVYTETENMVKLQSVLAQLHIKQCEH